MFIVALIFLACVGFAGIGRRAFKSLTTGRDPAAAWGLAGLFGLGIVAFLTLPIGLIPGGLSWGAWVMAGVAVIGLGLVVVELRSSPLSVAFPKGWALVGAAALIVAAVFALVGVLAPSDVNDWDSLAYHLAVPKIWLQGGRIEPIPSIHHSNFPFLVDNLFIWGLAWGGQINDQIGGQIGAKAFVWTTSIFGGLALFGLARQRYGSAAAWWTVVAFATIPSVLWESGTAYIDVAHGLWAGLAVLFLAEVIEDPTRKQSLWLAAFCAGFACASKYTGLQIVAAGMIALFVGFAFRKEFAAGIKRELTFVVVALAIVSPWLIKNVVWTGNPVYPFFYETFDGRNWSAKHAEIYKNEQQTFGVGRTDSGRNWLDFPYAVLGLAYQPGRYVNPGQTEGLGMPTGALGVIPLIALLLWPISGRAKRFEKSVLGIVVICFALWFALSQQSRYALNMGIPLTFLAGGAIARLRAGPLLGLVACLQGLYSLYLVKLASVDAKLPVVLGQVRPEDYQVARIPFAEEADAINAAQPSKVALYDEVFGFLLNVPYVWANPGHSTLIPYERLETGDALVDEFKRQGFSHVYVGFSFQPKGAAQRWREAAGLADSPKPFTMEERAALMASFEQRWKVLLAEAIVSGKMVKVALDAKGVLLQIR